MAEITPELRRWRRLIWSKDGPAGAAKRGILQVLFDYFASSKTAEIFPSVETIAEKTGIASKNAIRHLADLEAGGWLKRSTRGRSGQGWRRYQYELCFPPHFDAASDEWLNSVDRKRDEHREAEGWKPRTEEESERRAARVKPAPAAIVEPSELSRRREQARLQRQIEEVPRDVDPVAWRMYVEYRNRVDPMSDDAVRNAAGRLRSLDHEEAMRRVESTIKWHNIGLPSRWR